MFKGLYLIFFLIFTITSQSAWAQNSALHQVDQSLTIESTTNGESLQLGHDTYLRMLYDPNDVGGWSQKVMIVDEDNIPISDDIYRTSRKFFNRAVSVKFKESIEVLDENNETRKVPAGTSLVRVSDVTDGAWKHYRLVMVNELGEMVDWSGKAATHPPVLKTSMKNFDNANLNTHIQDVIASLVSEKDSVETSGPIVNVKPHCEGCEANTSPLAVKSSLRPVARPWETTKGKFWNGPKTPHAMVMAQRDSLKGKASCESKRREYENDLLSQTTWGKLSLSERAQRIERTAGESLRAIKEVSSDKGRATNYANSVNPNYISPVVTSDLVTCIAFQETSGSLNPFMHNYTYCNNTKNMVSTAHGLGMMTRGTFRKMKNHSEGDQLPYSSKYSQVLQGKSIREAHEYLSVDPHLQLEVSLRLLNFEIKFAKWKNPKASNDQLLKMAVTQYDHDNQSKYVKQVFDQCIPCLKKKTAGECYNEIWN